jgi:diphosphomevalonate decarboxylase
LCFTLDAGANVHLLYPEANAKEVVAWIASDLAQYCQNQQYIHDRVGSGAKKNVILYHERAAFLFQNSFVW